MQLLIVKSGEKKDLKNGKEGGLFLCTFGSLQMSCLDGNVVVCVAQLWKTALL